jgi:hypothetical protein
VTVAQHLRLATLCSPTEGKGCSNIGAVASVAEGEAPGVCEIEALAIPEEGVGLPLIVDPVAGRVGGSALVLHGEKAGPGEDPSVCPHPADPREAMFEVDDAAEQAAWGGAS